MKLLICTQAINKNHPILGFFHSWTLEFSKHAEEIHVICLEKGEYSFPPHVHVHSLGKEAGASKLLQLVRFYYHFARVFFLVRPTYVFFHMGAIYNVLAVPFFIIRRLFRVKFYWWKTHGQINYLGRLALLFVDRVYTAAAASFPIASKKRHIVGHAIDTVLFTPNPNIEKVIDILFAGRFSRAKRIEQVIAVVAELAATRPLRVVLIGQQTDAAYAAEIISLIKAKKLESTITIEPPVSQAALLKYYQTSKVFMNPSEHDGLDKVILEAMAAGTIPVTGNEAFRTILAGEDLLISKGDIAAFSARVQSVLELSNEKYQGLANRLRDSVVKNHSIDTLTRRIFPL